MYKRIIIIVISVIFNIVTDVEALADLENPDIKTLPRAIVENPNSTNELIKKSLHKSSQKYTSKDIALGVEIVNNRKKIRSRRFLKSHAWYPYVKKNDKLQYERLSLLRKFSDERVASVISIMNNSIDVMVYETKNEIKPILQMIVAIAALGWAIAIVMCYLYYTKQRLPMIAQA